ncbi:VCBS domain-containing protein [Salinicola sp. CPA57]|uniref:VCBS domain-containing protein n=1 Tax=Salinicola sp. CPA57 TaxID=1949080 RepID=UPI000DA219E2|nr:VCBS domain-containing protein [Salinicola sp. CPA57]
MKGTLPRSRLLALEPRLLFDGAAAATVDLADTDHATTKNGNTHHAAMDWTATERIEAPSNREQAKRHLVVIDARLEPAQRQTIADSAKASTELVVVKAGQDGVDAITSALAGMDNVQSIEIFSHGASGQFQLGNTHVAADTLGSLEDQLGQWRDALTPDADLLLYGCRVGADSAGIALVDSLAQATGTDVGASDDDTGTPRLHGDWQLETTIGDLDQPSGLDLFRLTSMDSLLADADPRVSLPSSGDSVPLGEDFNFTVNFETASSQEGYAPFINLLVPTTGKDGAGAEIDDGIIINSASYLGGSLDLQSVTFDANGEAQHPFAKDANGDVLVIQAADYSYQAGDTLVVISLPFASVTQDQPAIAVSVNATLSDLADTAAVNGSPNLDITAVGGFELGNDALDNPMNDPSLIGTEAVVFTVLPTVIAVEQTLDMDENETASGENHIHSLTTTVRPAGAGADTQSLTEVVVTQPIPTNVQVTAIDPGTGTLSAITLASGRVVNGQAAINALIARDDVFITEYTVTYDTLQAEASSRVDFYVPESDASGNPVLDPTTGDDVTITFGAPTGAGAWTPNDPRDQDPDNNNQIAFDGVGESVSFTAKSITLEKSATIAIDTGSSGISPGDTLAYRLDVALSDYFAFGSDMQDSGQFSVTDTLGNGQVLDTSDAPPSMTVTLVGADSVDVELIYTQTANDDGTTTLVFDIAASMQQAFAGQNELEGGLESGLAGDAAFDNTIDGTATSAVITYSALISQRYVTDEDHPEINEGDSLGNDALVDGSILIDPNNLSGENQSDDSSTNLDIPTGAVDISIEGGDSELAPGEDVTFSLRYELLTGDHENFQLITYLPLPLLDVSDIDWSEGDGPGSWEIVADNTHPGAIENVESGPGNAVIFTFEDFATDELGGSTIAVSFTMAVSDQPFADNRSLDILAQSRQTTTLDKDVLVSEDVVKVQSVAEPVVSITHGVVSTTQGTLTGTGSESGINWNDPLTSGVPFDGPITDPSVVDGDVDGIDAGDSLRLATVLENTGGGGAFDVSTSITLPSDLAFTNGSLDLANLTLTLGDGTTVLTEGTDYAVDGNTINLLDAGGLATLQAGRAGTANDDSGTNLVVIAYDVQVASAVAASRTLGTSATLNRYASVDNGSDFTPIDLTDDANQQVAAPEIRIDFADGSLSDDDSSEAHTTGADLVVGETMTYDIVVTLPEGSTQSLSVDDLIPAGMILDGSFNGGDGYELITTAAGSDAIDKDFAGTLTAGAFDTADGRLVIDASSVDDDNATNNNSFVVRLRLIAANTLGNQGETTPGSQSGTTHDNSAGLTYSDIDGDTVNGDAGNNDSAVDRDIALSGDEASTTLVEPTVDVEQTLTVPSEADLGVGVDEGDTVTFNVTLSNTSDIDAFGLTLNTQLPDQLNGIDIAEITGAAAGDFEIVDGVLKSVDGADIDLANGESIVVTLTGTVAATAADVTSLTSTAEVQWTSLDNDSESPANAAGERTGVDGSLNSGVLNDYQRSDTLTIPVAQALRVSRIGGLDDTAAADPTSGPSEDVAVGEIIRYRVVALIPEGSIDNYQLTIQVEEGLTIPPETANQILIAFIANQSELSSDLETGANSIDGNDRSVEAGNIPEDLDNGPTGVLNSDRYTISTDGRILTIDLGTLINGDNDADKEGLSLEFNVRVANVASNIAGQTLGMTVAESRDGATTSSTTINERIVEPGFSGLDKRVIAFDPNAESMAADATGSATVSLNFTQNGSAPAYDVVLSDSFPDGSNYSIDSVIIDGQSYTPDAFPEGVSLIADSSVDPDSVSVSIGFEHLDPGTSVTLTYSVDVPNGSVINPDGSQAILTWSSLPEDFQGFSGTDVGDTDGAEDGERNGDDGIGGSPNDYILTSGAGLGVISGTLWNDTQNANGVQDNDEAGFTGRTVTLTWAGSDGIFANVDDAESDDESFTATTDTLGQYQFGVLPTGLYRITSAETFTDIDPNTSAGDVRARIDSDDGNYGDGSLSSIEITLADGGTDKADIGYVELNDAPVNNLPTDVPSGDEDTSVAIDGLSISDPDARDPSDQAGANDLEVVLSVTQGTLAIANAGGSQIAGNNSNTVTLSGTVDEINTTLASLSYLGNANVNGTDTLTITTHDHGNFGDNPDSSEGNGIPGESSDDDLIDIDTLTITINAVNDAPVANDDTAIAVEAGGTGNNIPGVDPNGFVLNNDTDIDIATNGDTLRVSQAGIDAGSLELVDANPAIPLDISGSYGTLVIGSDGFAQYLVDNDNANVQALRTASDTLQETFAYEITDAGGLTSTASITVTINGANDTPVGVDDSGTATEAGGVDNGSGGQDATGDVLDNDTDVDRAGETREVSGIRLGDDNTSGAFDAVDDDTDSTSGTVIEGQYGKLTIGADGSYRYQIDDDNTDVQRLGAGDSLSEAFSYRVTDAAGLNGVANLVITVEGNQDAPVATDNDTAAQAPSTDGITSGEAGIGNVITDDDGNGIDSDVDAIDRPNTALSVSGIRPGSESAGGSLTDVNPGSTADSDGTAIAGLYGTLTLGADGSYRYEVDGNNLDVQRLPAGETLGETFTYRIVDSDGNVDLAQLDVTVTGANDPPSTVDDTATAIEAGGLDNANPGRDGGGNVLDNDSDVDGQDLTVNGFSQGSDTSSNASPGDTLNGAYGTLTLDANGEFSYIIDNDDPAVQALRTSSDTLTEIFTYTAVDTLGSESSATLTITIEGRNDNPIATNDSATAAEAGGTDNGAAGQNGSGNVLDNDSDVDVGDTLQVVGIRTGSTDDGGRFVTVSDTSGDTQVVQGEYGSLTLNADGSFTYRVDNDLAAVQALAPGDSLSEAFTYQMADTVGARDTAQLTLTIEGAWDAPVAADDLALAAADTPVNPTPGRDPAGNLLDNDSEVDSGDTLVVDGVRAGAEADGAVGSNMQAGGVDIVGTYGMLTVQADGSYTYVVDDAAITALGPINFVVDNFTYTAQDQGNLTDAAELTVYIRGRNDAPVANTDAGTAIEAGGSDNATTGRPASGNVLDNDSDPDDIAFPGALGPNLEVIAIRTGGTQDTGSDGSLDNALEGQYGSLVMSEDGSYRYDINDDDPAVQALRQSGQTLTDVFTYTIDDRWGATASAELTITLDGRNDNPIASDDAATAVEAGGVDNSTTGVDPTGNVLTNDTDVDGPAYGETKTVISVALANTSTNAQAGETLQGRYGTLTLNADGSYQYFADNDNADVQALRTAGETLTERFDYVMRDRAGEIDSARLTVVIQGANDTPMAADDSNLATDQTPSPQAIGNVLPNDSDVDANDSLRVIDMRPAGGGAARPAGEVLQGQYGTLMLNADGRYEYAIDLSNPDVLRAAGRGQILNDVFVYRVADTTGATTSANLSITLDIAAPYIPTREDGTGPHATGPMPSPGIGGQLPDVDPVVFVTPEVEQNNVEISNYLRVSNGNQPWLVSPLEIRTLSLRDRLEDVPGQFIGASIELSRSYAQQDQLLLLGRHGRTDLTADGLLSDPSLYAPTRLGLSEGQFSDGEPVSDGDAPSRESAPNQSDNRSGDPSQPASAVNNERDATYQTPRASETSDVTVARSFRQQLMASPQRQASLAIASDVGSRHLESRHLESQRSESQHKDKA